MAQRCVYMDHHATTPVDPRVLEAMLPYFTERFGNPGSVNHAYGHEAKEAVDVARAQIAAAIGAQPREIVFTSGATESNNLALRGVVERAGTRGNHLVSVTTEHKSVLDPLARLGRSGCDVTLVEVEQAGGPRAGWIDPDRIAAALTERTVLVSVMLANNEVGVIAPLAEISRLCDERGVLVHCDATQAVGKLPVDVAALDVDLMSFTAHKLYGPKGVGSLFVRRSGRPVRLAAQIDGGGQERGMRSGTLNVPGIVGFAKAIELCLKEMPQETARLAGLRRALFDGLSQSIDGVTLNGPSLDLPGLRLPGNLNVSFAGVDGEALMLAVEHLAVSSGSACTSANPEPSHVLRALGIGEDLTRASLRFGLGRGNSEADVAFAVEAVSDAVERLRKLSSFA